MRNWLAVTGMIVTAVRVMIMVPITVAVVRFVDIAKVFIDPIHGVMVKTRHLFRHVLVNPVDLIFVNLANLFEVSERFDAFLLLGKFFIRSFVAVKFLHVLLELIRLQDTVMI